MSEKIRSLVQRDFGRIISCIMSTGNRDWFRNIVIPRQDRPLFLICYNIYQYIFHIWNYVSIVETDLWVKGEKINFRVKVKPLNEKLSLFRWSKFSWKRHTWASSSPIFGLDLGKKTTINPPPSFPVTYLADALLDTRQR